VYIVNFPVIVIANAATSLVNKDEYIKKDMRRNTTF